MTNKKGRDRNLRWLKTFPKEWSREWLELYKINSLTFLFVWLGESKLDIIYISNRLKKLI